MRIALALILAANTTLTASSFSPRTSIRPYPTRSAEVRQKDHAALRAPTGPSASVAATCICGSFLDDLFGKSGDNKGKNNDDRPSDAGKGSEDGGNDDWDASGLRAEIERRETAASVDEAGAKSSSVAVRTNEGDEEDEEFNGYSLRDAIYEKYGKCFDVDFNRVESFGFRELYLNILPFHLGSRKFRHASEFDYLCHLQAIVEILQRYEQLDSVLLQLSETNKKPRPGTSPLIAVPLRLELSEEDLDSILGS